MIQTADFDHNAFSQESEADKTLLVRFYVKQVQDKTASEVEGRPIFKDREYIEIRYPGNRNDAVARPAKQADIERFPRHYEAFKKRVEMPVEGTPLAEWPAISRSQVEELAFYNVKTVEQLAAINDSSGHNFRGFYALRDKAKTFLEVSKQSATLTDLKTELKSRDKEIEALKRQLDELHTLVENTTQPEVVKSKKG